jgi:hypothetical protein
VTLSGWFKGSLCRCCCSIKLIFKFLINAPQTLNHLPRPINVLFSTLDRPICRRARRDCAQIARLVGEFQQLSSRALGRCSFNLFILSYFLRKSFVIRDFFDDFGNVLAECLSDQLPRHLAILNGVMQQRGNYKICITSACCLGDKHSDFYQMINVRLLRRPLTSLVYVPARGGIGSQLSVKRVYVG